MATPNKVDLANQVAGILPRTNGGIGISSTATFPVSGDVAVGPGSSTTGHIATFASTDGITLADGGAVPTGSVTSVATSAPLTGGPITTSGTIGITKSDATHDGYLASTDWVIFNAKQPAGSYALQATTITATSPLTGGGDLSISRSIGIQTASASQAGALSAADWTTFNGKGSGSVTSVAVTAPLTGGPITTTGTLAINQADSTHDGYLSQGDWNAFNGKGSGSVTSVGVVGTANQVTVTGTSPITSAGSLTLSLPSSLVLPSGTTATTQAQNNNSTSPATTAYTDLAVANAVAGVNPAVAVLVATTAAADTSGLTYNNGASGIGATFTGTINTALTIDGVTFSGVGQRLLVKNDTQSPSGAFNGIYYVTQIQTALLPPILTRALDYDQPSDMNNTGAIPVQSGTANGTTSWVLTSQIVTVGTTPLTFVKFSLAPSTIVTASSPGVGIAHFAGSTQAVTSSAVNLASADVTGITPIANGGTNASTAATAFANLVQNPTLTAAGGIVAGVAFFSTVGGSTALTATTQNNIRLYSFFINFYLIVSNIGWSVTTADNTSNSYDLGIYGGSGTNGCTNSQTSPLVAHTGTLAGTVLAPSTGRKSHALSGSSTLAPGWYAVALTSNAASPAFVLGSVNSDALPLQFASAGVSISGGGATLPGTITAPALAAGLGNWVYISLF